MWGVERYFSTPPCLNNMNDCVIITIDNETGELEVTIPDRSTLKRLILNGHTIEIDTKLLKLNFSPEPKEKKEE